MLLTRLYRSEQCEGAAGGPVKNSGAGAVQPGELEESRRRNTSGVASVTCRHPKH
jgi:hypothetical protein